LAKTGIPAYEVGHIQSGNFKETELIVKPDSDRILERHDILTGRVGGLGCFAEYPHEAPASFSDNTLRIRPHADQKPRVAFVTAFLNSAIGNAQLIRDSRGGLQKVVTQQSIGSIVVPVLGTSERRLVGELDAARAERDRALAEADRLLTSTDELVIKLLGIKPRPVPQRLGYALRLGSIKASSTLSADYFHPERMVALHQIESLPNAPLAEVVSFKRNIVRTPGVSRYIGLASVASQTGQLTDAVETATGSCFEFQAGDVLYGRLRPYLNKVWIADFDGVCSTEFHVMAPDPSRLLAEYLAVVMRTRLIVAQTKHMMTGNTHPRISNDDVARLLIPLANKATQLKIVEAAKHSQRQSMELRAHAETIWREAREKFERQLLKGTQP
jgi:hypothetical protein